MQQPSNPEPSSPLTPPAATRGFLSFAWAQGEAAQSKAPGPSSLDFDAGINTSSVWTEHLDSDSSRSRSASVSLSDDDASEDDHFEGEDDACRREARVLYAFAGKAEFRELDVKAGDGITVIREQVGDGWSLVKTRRGRAGLLPRSYYTVNPLPAFRFITPLLALTSHWHSSPSTSSPLPSLRRETRFMRVTALKTEANIQTPR
jgi:Variant SH3 domain